MQAVQEPLASRIPGRLLRRPSRPPSALRARGIGGMPPMAAAARRIAARPEYRRMIRGLMLTPWFAVSMGIVIAASLTLAAPRAALTFPPSTGGQCVNIGCAPAGHGPSGLQPAFKQDRKLRVLEPGQAGAQLSTIKVGYELLPRHRDRFLAVIVITDRKPLGKWSLEFVLPGAHIESIIWARWELGSHDSVLVEGAPLPWPRSGADQARIVIFGTGSPGWPRDCVIDGATCIFRGLPKSGRKAAARRPFARAS